MNYSCFHFFTCMHASGPEENTSKRTKGLQTSLVFAPSLWLLFSHNGVRVVQWVYIGKRVSIISIWIACLQTVLVSENLLSILENIETTLSVLTTLLHLPLPMIQLFPDPLLSNKQQQQQHRYKRLPASDPRKRQPGAKPVDMKSPRDILDGYNLCSD